MSAFTDLLNNAEINDMTALEFAIFKMYPDHQEDGEKCAAELAALREQVRDGDKRVLQLMSEIEMRSGNSGHRWDILRSILSWEGGGK